MIRTGEESGSLLQLLSNLSEIYENDLEQWVAGMNSLLEPLIISLLGLIVGSLVLAHFQIDLNYIIKLNKTSLQGNSLETQNNLP